LTDIIEETGNLSEAKSGENYSGARALYGLFFALMVRGSEGSKLVGFAVSRHRKIKARRRSTQYDSPRDDEASMDIC
jgi:hypothetical protein